MVNESSSERPNVVRDKSYAFALSIISTYKKLMLEKEYVLSKQLLRSGTSIGANVEEALQAQSKADFIHKLSIAQKESFETNYWLRLLRDSAFLSTEDAESLLIQCDEVQRILTSIIKTSKANKANS